MAIDSRIKRSSVVAISALFLGPVIVPDGAIAQFDRQVAGYGYGGVASTIAAFAADETVTLDPLIRTIEFSTITRTITFERKGE